MHPRFAFYVSTLKTLTTWMFRGRIRGAVAISLLVFAIVPDAAAYTQNTQLERELGNSDPRALALLPAQGFKDGAAGFFRAHSLYVVPDSQRAWCSEYIRGVLKPGCYIELFMQGEGIKPRNSHGDPCGAIGRWYKAPGSSNYVPTSGTFISNAMANGDWDSVVFAIYEGRGEKSSPPGSCDRTIDPKMHRN
jgi:hypothetical protein